MCNNTHTHTQPKTNFLLVHKYFLPAIKLFLQKSLTDIHFNPLSCHYTFKTVISNTTPKLILTNYKSFESLQSVVFIFGD